MIPIAIKCGLAGKENAALVLSVCARSPVYSRGGSLYDYNNSYGNFMVSELGKFKSLDQVADYMLFGCSSPMADKLSREAAAQRGSKFCYYQELAPEIKQLITLSPFLGAEFSSWSKSYSENMRGPDLG